MVLGISPIYHIAAEPHSLRTGSFTITLSPGKLLGEAAQKVASVIPVDEPISWEVYIPESYGAESPAGIVVYVSPSQSGRPPRGWTSVMDEHNLIWIGANKSGNRVLVSRRVMKVILALNAIQQEYVLDETRIYVAGFSGGGKTASMIATDYADTFDGGFFVCGVEFWNVDEPQHFKAIQSNRYVFLTGESDHALLYANRNPSRNLQPTSPQNVYIVNIGTRAYRTSNSLLSMIWATKIRRVAKSAEQ